MPATSVLGLQDLVWVAIDLSSSESRPVGRSPSAPPPSVSALAGVTDTEGDGAEGDRSSHSRGTGRVSVCETAICTQRFLA